jgi:hypothetical protein
MEATMEILIFAIYPVIVAIVLWRVNTTQSD